MSISSFISCRHHQTTRYVPLYNNYCPCTFTLFSGLATKLARYLAWNTVYCIYWTVHSFEKDSLPEGAKSPNVLCAIYQCLFHESHSCVVCTCTLFRENASILTHLPTYPPTCLPINLLTHQPTYPPTCMPINPPTHLPAYLPTCLLTYVPAHPPTFLPTYLPSDLPTYLFI